MAKEIHYDGFYLSFECDEKVNDKDITARSLVDDRPPVEIGTFTFNKSKKYGSKYTSLYS